MLQGLVKPPEYYQQTKSLHGINWKATGMMSVLFLDVRITSSQNRQSLLTEYDVQLMRSRSIMRFHLLWFSWSGNQFWLIVSAYKNHAVSREMSE